MRRRPPPKLLDDMRNKLRLKKYAWETEQAYVHWVKRFLQFHKDRNGADGGIPGVWMKRTSNAT